MKTAIPAVFTVDPHTRSKEADTPAKVDALFSSVDASEKQELFSDSECGRLLLSGIFWGLVAVTVSEVKLIAEVEKALRGLVSSSGGELSEMIHKKLFNSEVEIGI